MGVYITGMELPTSPVLFCIHPNGKVFADLEGGWREYKAVPVPPHGRLIDADALMEYYTDEIEFYASEDEFQCGNMKVPIAVIRQNVMDAPTIIEGEDK